MGAPLRYELSQLIHVARNGFPWATLLVNVSGSFALGLLLVVILERLPSTGSVQRLGSLRPLLATGFLGAYTTYSTFAVEGDLLAKNGHAGLAVAYAAASLVAGFLAVWAGMVVARPNE